MTKEIQQRTFEVCTNHPENENKSPKSLKTQKSRNSPLCSYKKKSAGKYQNIKISGNPTTKTSQCSPPWIPRDHGNLTTHADILHLDTIKPRHQEQMYITCSQHSTLTTKHKSQNETDHVNIHSNP